MSKRNYKYHRFRGARYYYKLWKTGNRYYAKFFDPRQPYRKYETFRIRPEDYEKGKVVV